MNVALHLQQHASLSPDRLAIQEPSGGSVTFGALQERVAGFASALSQRGIGPGDRLLVLVPIGIPLYVALIGTFRAGATAVLVDPSMPRQTLRALMQRTGIAGLIGSPKAHLLRLRDPEFRGLRLYLSSGFTLLPHRSIDGFRAPAQPPVEGGAHPALITFTSGTTGLPKAMGRTHGFLEAQHHVLAEHMGMSPDDIDLPTLPVFLLNSLAAGATCILPDADLTQVARVDPARVVRQMREWKVSSTSGSPAFFEPIARYLEAQDQALPDLRKAFIGGGRVRPELLRLLERRAPSARIEVVYGSTECEPIATLNCAESLDLMRSGERAGRGACVGQPVPGLKLALWSPQSTEETDCGEVVVTGAHVNKGYLDNPEAEAECKVSLDGEIWHRTGDVATRDEDGRLWLQGRVGQAVNGRYPFPVEAAAESAPFIRRAALVSCGDLPTLAVELSDTPPEGALEALERELDVHIRSVDEIPVDARHNTKIDRLALIQKLTEDAERR